MTYSKSQCTLKKNSQITNWFHRIAYSLLFNWVGYQMNITYIQHTYLGFYLLPTVTISAMHNCGCFRMVCNGIKIKIIYLVNEYGSKNIFMVSQPSNAKEGISPLEVFFQFCKGDLHFGAEPFSSCSFIPHRNFNVSTFWMMPSPILFVGLPQTLNWPLLKINTCEWREALWWQTFLPQSYQYHGDSQVYPPP